MFNYELQKTITYAKTKDDSPMYNSISPNEVPPYLPIAATVLLETWFSSSNLTKGLDLLKAGALSKFFVFRNGVGCLFEDRTQLYLLFENTNRISQGFTIKSEHCELCGYNAKGTRCEHIAALAVLSILERSDSSYFPAPLLFKKSMWGKVAEFLYDWLSQEQGAVDTVKETDFIKLARTAQDGKVECCIKNGSAPAPIIFENHENVENTEPVAQRLYDQLKNICRSPVETQLIASGAASKGWKRDTSLWSQISVHCFIIGSSSDPVVSYDPDSGYFTLKSESENDICSLDIVLPKQRTFELLQKLGEIPGKIKLRPPGRQGSLAEMDQSGNILVDHIVHVDEVTHFLLTDLKANKFGNYYYFPDEGFLKLRPIKPEAKITGEQCDISSSPLFAFAQPQSGFIIEKTEIAKFLTKNKTALEHPDNIVAPEVMSVRVTEIPDGLVVRKFREENGWFYLSFSFELGGIFVPFSDILSKQKKGEDFSAGQTILVLDQGPLTWFYDTARKSSWKLNCGERGVKLTRGEFAALATTIPRIETEDLNGEQQQVLKNFNEVESWTDINSAIRFPSHLREYQKNGLSWLNTIVKLGLGGVLADDMGLGKTHQALALIELVQHERQTGRVLVVCPASVLLHWAEKIDQFYSDLQYYLYYGPERDVSQWSEKKLVITTYGVLRTDQETLRQGDFEIIILDEVQALKNRNTATHQAVKSISGRVKIGLSGTPIENSLADLYSIFDICLPGFFRSFERFKRSYLVVETNKGHTKKLQSLRKKLHPFILRRSRSQVLVELPDLISDTMSCELSEKQQELYNDTLASNSPLLHDLADEGKRVDYIHIFKMISRLKRICNHPCLVENCTDPYRHQSGKWDLFVELLEESLASGRKVVVFSQYLGMLDLIQRYLGAIKIGSAELRGDMNIAKRKVMIDTFNTNDECRVFTASLLAGGTGIDLIAGKVVIHYDRWWNAAKEEQATARVHRLGQTDTVQLFQLITRGTIEEKINAIISAKKQLSKSVVIEDEVGAVKQFTRAQLLEILGGVG